MTKPTKPQVAYLPGNPDGSRKQCSNCYAWDRAKRCAIHAADLEVPANAVCTYHVFGEPQGKKHMATMPPKLSGLAVVPGGTSCDICIAFDTEKSTCELIDPKDNTVEPKGCCGMWYQKEKRDDIQVIRKGNHTIQRRTTFRGVKIAVETDKGQERHWYDPATGKRGSNKMHYPYGYFEGTKASGLAGDGMALDVFVGPVEDADEVYIVHQMKGPEFKTEDELKVMIGFESAKQARAAYLSHYDDERFLGDVDTMTWSAFVDKYIEPFAKALAGKDVGQLPSSAAGSSTMQSPNSSGAQPQLPTDTPAPVRMPGMPGMGLGALMQPQMMPPPIDVETLDGVNSLLSRVGGMKDGELLSTVEKIWGPGYQFINATPEHIRCEIRGFLLDQRDVFEALKEMQEQAMAQLQIPPAPPAPMQPQLPGLPGQMSSPSLSPSNGSLPNGGAVLAVVSLPQGGSAQPSSNSSSPPAPSSSPLSEGSKRSEFIPMSSDS